MIIDSLLLPNEWISVIQEEIDEKNEKSAVDRKIEKIEKKISLLTKDYQDFCDLYTQEERDENILNRKKLYEDLRMLKAQQSQNSMKLDYSQIMRAMLYMVKKGEMEFRKRSYLRSFLKNVRKSVMRETKKC